MTRNAISIAVPVLLLVAISLGSATPAYASCESIRTLRLPDTTITAAEVRPAGTFTAPGAATTSVNPALRELPAFCRVAATLKPTPDSDIKIEVWMPETNWNGKFLGVGNRGWAGSISYADMGEALKRGYATSSTDTGHVGGSGSFALGHPEKLIDYGHRSTHEMTVKAKAIINSFYGNAPRFSYWDGCAMGGRQGLKEAQMYPEDYDGIIAGAPSNPRTRLNSWALYVGHAGHTDKASYIPETKYPMIHEAVLASCDANDGLKDGLIDDPTQCKFDFGTLACKAGDSPSCLTPGQLDSARRVTTPVTDPRTGQEIFPGLSLGAELGWGTQMGPEPKSVDVDYFKYIVFKDPNWDWRTFDFATGVVLADQIDNGTQNAIDPNLTAFKQHGGKLLMYHGWNGQNVPPLSTVNYYKSVLDRMGGLSQTSEWARLFMIPGGEHCDGGEGPNTFDAVTALDQWVEKQIPPDRIIASHSTGGKVDRTRPLCPYPQVARYDGSGSIDDATNFVCKLP